MILGAGGHAKVIISIVKQLKDFEIVGICDDDSTKLGLEVLGVPVKWRTTDLSEIRQIADSAFVGIGSVGDPSLRIRFFEEIKKHGFNVPILISPQAVVSEDVAIDEGTVVMPGAIVNPGAHIGKNCIINTGSVIDHDCVIEDHVHIAPGATLSGGVYVSRGAHVGTGVSIIQGIRVGEFSIVGAGAVVVKDVSPWTVVVGVPARLLRKLEIRDIASDHNR